MTCLQPESQHEALMARAIQIATNGQALVAPNPMVGAVLARDGQILAEGYHAHFGGPHAERAAIECAQRRNIDLHGATLYVSLEPCNHDGKQPPCTQAIIEAGISSVYIASNDPNPLVNGQGIQALRDAGIEVQTGILQQQADYLNRRFFTYHTKKRPYIILKWAQSLDGFIDARREDHDQPVWLSNNASRLLVHKWRSQEMAILVGTNTAVRDNPQLNVRHWHGQYPLRVILDRTLRVPPEYHIFDGSTPTLIIAGNNQGASTRADSVKHIPNLELLLVDFMKGIERIVLDELRKRNITSLIIEGGALVLSNFLKRGYWDEARIFTGDQFLGQGVQAPALPQGPTQTEAIGTCLLHTITNPAPRAL